jgi:8-oxo-dGTP pyrophosphatase MutT (NUDIX family)
MKGRSDPEAAAQEAREEAGLEGKISRKSIGSYSYWKRLKTTSH